MTTPARHAEADRVEIAYKWALAQVGVQTVQEALALFYQEVPATPAAAKSKWLRYAVRLVLTRRARARDLALAYYRLVRALRIDAAIKLPNEKGTSTTLAKLRDEFDEAMDAIVPREPPRTNAAGSTDGERASGPPELNETPQGLSATQPEWDTTSEDDEDRILLEEIKELEAEIERQDREAEAEAQALLDQLGMQNLLDKMQEISDEIAAKEADRLRDEALQQAAARQAATAARIVMNAARGITYSLAETDARVLGWARYSTTGTPCGWCAMLISRGVLYKSRVAAQPNSINKPGQNDSDLADAGDQNKFHDNDYCIAIPVFDVVQMQSPIYDLNRELRQLWDKEIAGKFHGADAIAEFRRLMRRRKKLTPAQAAA